MKLPAKSCGLLVVLSIFYVGVAGQSPTPDPQPPSGPQDADAPVNSEVLAAPVPSPSQVPSSLGSAATFTPIMPYLNGSTLDTQMLQNLTYRFIGADLFRITPNFRAVVQKVADDLTFGHFTYNEVIIRPGVQQPVYGPDGINGSREAYAPTPGRVDYEYFAGGRKMLAEFGPQTLKERFTALMGIDVEMRFYGGSNASIVVINRPVNFNGYLVVQMAQQGVDIIQVVPLNTSTTYNILPITTRMPLTPNYVLGTVLRFQGTGFFPANTQGQNMLIVTLVQIMGSQDKFMYNRIQQVVQDEAKYLMTIAVLTYTNTRVSSMNEVAGGNVEALMDQIAAAASVNFTALVMQSRPLGTQYQEITGDSNFIMDPYVQRTVVPSPSSGGRKLSGGAIAGIVIGGVAAIALAALLLGFIVWRSRKSKPKAWDIEEGGKETPSNLTPLKNPIMISQDTSPGSSRASEKKTSASSSPSSAKKDYTFAALNDSWVIKREELAVRQLPNGKDWLLGSGSFGLVFRGLRGGIQDVAIKQMNKPGTVELKMFEKEVALLRHLNFDKNLVQFYGACIADDNLMLVLEYMDGGDLKDAISNDCAGNLLWAKKGASVLCDIARGLHFLHSNRVAHRDLKSKNVLLTRAWEAKIADVGLAKLVGSQLMSTQLNVAGTFSYAAPEMLLNEPCDTRADLYSLGVIIWEVVTHETPVRGGMRKINVPAEAPEEVAELIGQCLARDPAVRPTAKEAFESLQRISGLQPEKWTVGLPPVTEESNPLSSSSTSANVDTVSSNQSFMLHSRASPPPSPEILSSQSATPEMSVVYEEPPKSPGKGSASP